MMANTALKQAYADCVKTFGLLFQGERPPLEAWFPFIEMLVRDVRQRFEVSPTSLVVTWSAYPYALREYIRKQLAHCDVVVLNDIGQAAARRKYLQTLDKAKAQGKTLEEFLSQFGVKGEDATEAVLMSRLSSIQRGFESAHDDEFGVDVDPSFTADDVLRRVVEKFGLHK